MASAVASAVTTASPAAMTPSSPGFDHRAGEDKGEGKDGGEKTEDTRSASGSPHDHNSTTPLSENAGDTTLGLGKLLGDHGHGIVSYQSNPLKSTTVWHFACQIHATVNSSVLRGDRKWRGRI